MARLSLIKSPPKNWTMAGSYLNELRKDGVVELVRHGVGRSNVLDVAVVLLDVGGQGERVGRENVLLVGLVVLLITLSAEEMV